MKATIIVDTDSGERFEAVKFRACDAASCDLYCTRCEYDYDQPPCEKLIDALEEIGACGEFNFRRCK